MQKIKGFLLSKRQISVIIVVLLIAGGTLWYFGNNSKQAASSTSAQQTAAVRKGNISMTVTGSGAIVSSSKSDIAAKVQGTVTDVLLKDGDQVKAGDLILKLDSFQAQLNVKQLENSIEQTKLKQEYNKRSLEGVMARAPFFGEITDIQVNVGDDISKNASLLTITDKSKLKLTTMFNNSAREKLRVNQEVKVNAYDIALDRGTLVNGHIASVSEPLYKTAQGGEVYNVEVVLDNPGTVKEGMVANAEISVAGGEIRSMESGTLSYFNNVTVKAETGGTVEKINVYKGQPVDKGTVMVEFSIEDLLLEIQTAELQLQDLNNQLEAARNELDKYNIYSPIDGVMTLNDLEVGDVLKAGDVIGYTADYSHMEFEIAIDELDISKIKTGQQVNVTIDALTETNRKPIAGVVSKVAVEGNPADGVTTYPVTIQIDKADSLKSGMNANAEVLVEHKSDVLLAPIQAVTTRGGKSLVYIKRQEGAKTDTQAASETANNTGIKSPKTNAGQNINAEPRTVEIGIHNEEYIEIVSGLKEGEEVIIPSTSENQSSGQTPRNMNGGGMDFPGVGGGMAAPAVRQRP